jgi:hypothetical protein
MLLRLLEKEGNEEWENGKEINIVESTLKELALIRTCKESENVLQREPRYTNLFNSKEIMILNP